MSVITLLKRIARKFYDRDKAFLDRLRKQGATVGDNVQIVDRFRFQYEPWCANLLEIGDEAVISAGVRLVSHDSSYANIVGDLPIRYGRIVIEKHAYIGVNAIILPGVTIGESSLIGAGSVVNRDIPPRSIAAGNPVRIVSTLDAGLARYQERVAADNVKGVRYLDLGGSYRQMRQKWGKDVATMILKKYREYMLAGEFD
jgi:acetyltransferase-like isoleucine patch superfamily enzyme